MKAREIRERVIGSISKPGLLVTLKINGEDVPLELKQPSLELKGAIATSAGARTEGDGYVAPDLALFVAFILIRCAYEPGTFKRVFSESDLDVLLAHGPELDSLSQAALNLIQGEVDAKKESPPPTS